jgi:hypothetical protein
VWYTLKCLCNGNTRWRGEKKQGIKIFEETMTENLPNVMGSIDLPIHKAQKLQLG